MEENTSGGYDSTKKNIEDAANNLGNEARKEANEFKESWNQTMDNAENKKLLAGILGIVIGSLGIHKFVLGYYQEGIIMAACWLVGLIFCGLPSLLIGIVGLVEGIIYLTKTDEEFYQTYQVGKKGWF